MARGTKPTFSDDDLLEWLYAYWQRDGRLPGTRHNRPEHRLRGGPSYSTLSRRLIPLYGSLETALAATRQATAA